MILREAGRLPPLSQSRLPHLKVPAWSKSSTYPTWRPHPPLVLVCQLPVSLRSVSAPGLNPAGKAGCRPSPGPSFSPSRTGGGLGLPTGCRSTSWTSSLVPALPAALVSPYNPKRQEDCGEGKGPKPRLPGRTLSGRLSLSLSAFQGRRGRCSPLFPNVPGLNSCSSKRASSLCSWI